MGAAVSQGDTHQLQYEIQWASLALLYYDYALTFTQEVQHIWMAKFSLSTLLYILCRYALLANVLYLLAISNKLQSGVKEYNTNRCYSNIVMFGVFCSCDHWYRFVAALSVFGRAAIIVTLLARTYAVCARNRVILVLLSCVGIACVVTDAVSLFIVISCGGTNSSGRSSIFQVKNASTPCKPHYVYPLTVLSNLLRSLLTIVFETSVAFLTTVRTVQACKLSGPWYMQKNRLGYLIFEEGILYFCFISTLTITSVILDLRAPAGYLQRLLDALTLPLSGFMTARFILHLRRWRDEQLSTGLTIPSSSHNSTGLSSFLRSRRKSSVSISVGQQGHRISQAQAQADFAPARRQSEYSTRLSVVNVKPEISEFGDDPVERARRLTVLEVVELQVRVDREAIVLDIGGHENDDNSDDEEGLDENLLQDSEPVGETGVGSG